MTTEKLTNEQKISSRLQQAKEAAKVADLLIQNQQFAHAVNRIYYGMFYSVSAVAMQEDTELTADDVAMEWLKTNTANKKFPPRFREMMQQAYANRQKVDYEIDVDVNEGDVKVMYDTLQEFVEVMENYINRGEIPVTQDLDADAIETMDETQDAQMVEEQLSNYRILVPWDFSSVAKYALQHAVNMAKKVNGKITLLHIVKKEKEISKAEDDIRRDVEDAIETYGIQTDYIVKDGNIFSQITEVANEIKAKMVVMGTHGVKGMQKLTGSYALKVIADTKSPFVVVQAPPIHDEIKNIVFPVDYRREIKQKLTQARFLAKVYNVKFHICIPKTIASTLTLQKTTNNLKFVRSYFKANDIDYEVHYVDGTSDFAEATIKFAKETQPDMIIILITKDISIADFILGADEEKIIANTVKVPVMCINPLHGKNYSYRTGTS